MILTKRTLLIALVCSLFACTSAPSGHSTPALEAGEDYFTLPAGQRLQLAAELEAWSANGNLLLWMVDDDPQLYLLEAYASPSPRQYSTPAPLAAEVICLSEASDGIQNVFLGDGDGVLIHYWLWLEREGIVMREVRQLWTNPDVESCWIKDQSLVIENGPLGQTAYTLDEEQDPVLSRGARNPLVRDTKHPTVQPVFETDPVQSSGDAADDPVILNQGKHSWIVGTDKQWGLHAYDLTGAVVASVGRGRLNNVDAVPQGDNFLLAASNRSEGSIDLFIADPSRQTLKFSSSIGIDVNDPYGLCMGTRDDNVVIFVGGTDGEVQYWQLADHHENGTLVRTFNFASQTEGCVYDQVNDALFVGEEAVGIWRIDLKSYQRELTLAVDGELLVADVEGLDICTAGDHRVLLASSQGDDSYVAWPLDDTFTPLKFRITADPRQGIDGASETDGLACHNSSIGNFERGLLIVQDGRNRAPADRQNYKAVNWIDLERLLLQQHQAGNLTNRLP